MGSDIVDTSELLPLKLYVSIILVGNSVLSRYLVVVDRDQRLIGCHQLHTMFLRVTFVFTNTVCSFMLNKKKLKVL